MKKLIAMIPTTGKTKQEIISLVSKHLREKGYMKEPDNEYTRREDMLLKTMEKFANEK